jgi:hypothetical protein
MAFTQNQLDTYFNSVLGRNATPYEFSTYSTASPQTLANLKNTYGSYNTDSSIVDYLKSTGQDPNSRVALGQKYGIADVGTAEGNTALLKALKAGTPPPPVTPAAPVKGTVTPVTPAAPPVTPAAPVKGTVTPVTPAAPIVEQPTPGNDPTTNATTGSTSSNPIQSDGTIGGSISAAAGSNTAVTDPTNPLSDPTIQGYQKAYTDAQSQVSQIDTQIASLQNSISQSLQQELASAHASGAPVDEAQITAQVYQTNSALTAQINTLRAARSAAAGTQSTAGKQYQDAITAFKDAANTTQAQEKIDNQSSQFDQKEQDTAAKLEQAGWKETKENVYDEYGNVTGQTTVWSQNPSDGGATGGTTTATGNVSGIPTSGGTSTGSNAAKNIAPSGLTNMAMPLSQVISQYGIDSIVAGIIKNEGGSLPGVQNNPGNIKFNNLPGQTDSGISNDGGKTTFANYTDATAGKAAIASIVQRAAAGNSSAYGKNPTFQDFVNKYTNTLPNTSASGAVSNSSTPASTDLATGSTVNISTPGYTTSTVNYGGKDTQLTQSYIDQTAVAAIMAGGVIPSSVSRATKGLPVVQMDAIKARIGQLDPGGNLALNKTEAQAWGKTITTQIAYATTLNRSLSSADADFQQILSTYNGTGINDSSMPISNIIANASKYNLGDGQVSAFKASLSELSRLYSQVFSNSGQTTDATNKTAQDIINGNLSIANLTDVANQLQALGKIDVGKANDAVTQSEQSYKGIVPGAAGSDPSTGGSGTSFSARSDNSAQGARDFVANTFATLYPGTTEAQLQEQYSQYVKDGEVVAFRNSDGKPYVVNPKTDNMSLYTPI